MTKIRWGVLSTARIGTEKVIPAMQQCTYSKITAIASRDSAKAELAAGKLNIPKRYGSYNELLADKEIDAVYIPLPNHLHVEWAVKCLQAGKHVLCEKPIGLNLQEAEYLETIAQQFPDLKIMEAFMYRFHPQWQTILKLISDGIIGEVKHINSMFLYYNINPLDIRNQKEIGGGGLLDIGCYCISLSRLIFGDEPERVFGSIQNDEHLKIDKMTSGIMEFKKGTSSFTCSTQLNHYQGAKIFGTKGVIEIEFPFTPDPAKPTSIKYRIDSEERIIEFKPCNQYTIQGDAFSLSILKNESVLTPLKDGVNNMRVIEGIFESARQGTWVNIF